MDATLTKLATDLKAAIEAVEGDVEYRCALATNIICRLLPEAEHCKGTYGGEQHYWAAVEVDGKAIIIDATVSQFADAPEVFVGEWSEEYEGGSYGNTTIESNANDEAVMAEMLKKGWAE